MVLKISNGAGERGFFYVACDLSLCYLSLFQVPSHLANPAYFSQLPFCCSYVHDRSVVGMPAEVMGDYLLGGGCVGGMRGEGDGGLGVLQGICGEYVAPGGGCGGRVGGDGLEGVKWGGISCQGMLLSSNVVGGVGLHNMYASIC